MIIETIKYDPTNPFKPFIFIGENLNPSFTLPKPITEHSCLTLANPLQVSAIKQIAKPDKLLLRHSSVGHPTNFYEYDFIKTKSEHGHSYTPIPLASKDYRYWIVELSEYLADFDLVQALYLSSKRLTVIAQIGSIHNYIDHALISSVFYSDQQLMFHEPTVIDQNDIDEIKSHYHLLKNFKSSEYENTFIGKAILDYRNTLDIEATSPFKIIALFSIIETLLTSNQQNNQSSINRQLQKKIQLINNQFTNKICFTDYFKGPNTLSDEIIIQKLYYYRSKIAHGDYYDFNNDLQVLVDHETTCKFLELLLKRLLIYAMGHPQLITDLKEC